MIKNQKKKIEGRKSEKKIQRKIWRGGKFFLRDKIFSRKILEREKNERESFTKSIEKNLKRKTFTSKIKKLG